MDRAEAQARPEPVSTIRILGMDSEGSSNAGNNQAQRETLDSMLKPDIPSLPVVSVIWLAVPCQLLRPSPMESISVRNSMAFPMALSWRGMRSLKS